MILSNPSGRAIRLEILTGDDEAAMALTIGAHASVDLDRYQRALDALAWAAREDGSSDDASADQQQ